MELERVPKYVIDPQVGLYLAERESVVGEENQILAPTLFRSQILSLLYQSVREGTITKKEANRRLSYLRSLRMRLLGDRVLQEFAWKFAEKLDWADTLDAEYLALTHLQADAFITLDAWLAKAAKGIVETEPIEVLLG